MINLLEKIPSSIDFESLKGCVNIALTPEACFILNESGVPYTILEDYYSEAELISLEDDYLEQKVQWLRELDSILAKKLPDFGNYAGGICSHYLGYSAIHYSFDNVLIRSFVLGNLWKKKVLPERIRYYRTQSEERFNDLLLFNGNTVFSRLIPLFCKKYHTDLDEIIVSSDRVSDGRSRSLLLEKARSIAGVIYSDIKRQKVILSRKSSLLTNKKPLGFLFLAEHWGLDLLLAEAIQRGHRCYLLKDNKIVEIGKHNQKTVFHLKEDAHSVSDAWTVAVKEILETRSLWEWFNQLCDVPVSIILKPKIEYFLVTTAPKLLSLIEQFSIFLSKHDISYVGSAVLQSIQCSSAAYAARQQGVGCIQIRHGETIRDARIWEFREICPNDHLIVVNKEVGDYFTSKITNLGLDRPKVHITDYQFKNITKIKEQRYRQKEKRNKDSTKPLVVYVPTAFMFDTRYLHGSHYPCTWYYQLQRHLVDYFATRKDYDFVFKALPASDAIYSPIPLYLKKNKFENITYSEEPFRNWLSKAEHVLIDYPETALYETIAAGVPYFVLLHSLFKVRQKAVDMLGERCITFTTIEDAINAVRYFLDNPDLPLNLEGFIESGCLLKSLEELSTNKESL